MFTLRSTRVQSPRSKARLSFLRTSALLLTLAAGGAGARATLMDPCGDPFKNAFGPFDYRTAPQAKKDVVEEHHFTPNVETLRSGNQGHLGGELDYTLRAFPNHPRALMAMVRLGKRDKTQQAKGALYPVSCYLQRAVQFAPDDPQVRLVRGIYFAMDGKHEEAIKDLVIATERDPKNAGAHYNLGLAYFETKDYERAMEEAKIARSLGLTLPGLGNKLKSVGRRIDE